MFDFRLKVFASVARNLSFTRAAQELYISQPAISKHIRELEGAYHVRLFERQGNRVALTPAGQLLLTHADRLLDGYRQLEYDMHLLQGEHTGELRLGASTTIAQYVLPGLLADFIRHFPHVKMSLLNGNTQAIETALLEHRIDLGLVEGLSRRPDLHYTPFMRDELVPVVRHDTGLPVGDELSAHDLPRFPLVLRERGSGTLEVVEQALAGLGVPLASLQVLMYLGSTEGIKRFLEQTDCIGIVSVRSIDRELAAGAFRVVELKELRLMREFCFVQPQGEAGGLARTFMDFV